MKDLNTYGTITLIGREDELHIKVDATNNSVVLCIMSNELSEVAVYDTYKEAITSGMSRYLAAVRGR